MQPDARPGRFGYFAAGAFAVAGMAGTVMMVLNLITAADAVEQFIVPGSHAFVVKEPGKHVVWNDYRTVFQGQAYDVPERLPNGLKIRVTETASGQPVEVSSSRGTSSKTGAAERVSIASFEALAPGRYEIAVEGDLGPRVFSVGPNILPRLFLTILGAIAAMLVGLSVALGLALWTFLKRNPAQPVPRPAAASGAAPPPSLTPEESGRQAAMIVYALQAASFLVGISLIAGIIVNTVKRDDVAGTWLESHFTWQIRTFWWWLVWLVVGLVLLFVVVGIFVWIADAIWLLYRIVKGWIRLSEGKPMYASEKP